MSTPEQRIAAGQELRRRGRLTPEQDAALTELERRLGGGSTPFTPTMAAASERLTAARTSGQPMSFVDEMEAMGRPTGPAISESEFANQEAALKTKRDLERVPKDAAKERSLMLMNAATFGNGPRLAAASSTMGALLATPFVDGDIIDQKGISGATSQFLEDARLHQKRGRDERPIESFALEAVPGLLQGKTVIDAFGKNVLKGKPVSASMAGGAAVSALYGGSQNESGNLTEVAGDTAVGGVLGAALAPAIQFVLFPAVKGLAYRVFTPAETKAMDMVIRRAERSGTSLDDVRAQFDAWKKTGEVPETLAEMMGAQERQLLSAMITVNRETRENASEVLIERGKGEVDRLEGAFARAMDTGREDFPKVKAEAARARAEDPEPFYDAAHYEKVEGQQIRRKLQPRVSKALVDEIRNSEVALDSLKKAATYADTMRLPTVRDELRFIAAAIERGETQTIKITVQAADYLERVINRRLERAIEGRTDDIPAGLRTLRDSIRTIIDPSGVGAARATAAERIQRGRLLEEGRKFMHKDVDEEDIVNILSGDPDAGIAPAGDEGRRHYIVGAARAISDELRNTSDAKGFADATRKIARTPAIRSKIDTVRMKKLTTKGDEDKRARQTRLNRELDDAIERTARRAEFTADQLGNSKTAFRMQDVADAELDDQLSAHFGSAVTDTLTGGPMSALANASKGMAARAGDWIGRPGIRNSKINQAASKILLASGDEIPAQLARLGERVAKRGKSGKKVGRPRTVPAIEKKAEAPPIAASGFGGMSFRELDRRITGGATRGIQKLEGRMASPNDPRHYGPEMARLGVPDELAPGRALYDQVSDPRPAAEAIATAASKEGGTPSGQRAVEYINAGRNERLRGAIANDDRAHIVAEKQAATRALNTARKNLEEFFGERGGHRAFKTQKAKRAEQLRLAKELEQASQAHRRIHGQEAPRRTVGVGPEREDMIIQEMQRAEKPAGFSTRTQMFEGVKARLGDRDSKGRRRGGRRPSVHDPQSLRVERDGQQMPVLPRQKRRVGSDRRAAIDNASTRMLLDPEMATAGAYAARSAPGGFAPRPLAGRAAAYGAGGLGGAGLFAMGKAVEKIARENQESVDAWQAERDRPISDPPEPTRNLWVSLDSNNRYRLQNTLNYANDEQIPVDGEWGGKTQEALAEFQEKNGLPVTGVLDNQTLKALNLLHDQRVYEWSKQRQ